MPDLRAALYLVTGVPFDPPSRRPDGYTWLNDPPLDHEYVAMIVDVAHNVATHHLGAGEPQFAATAQAAIERRQQRRRATTRPHRRPRRPGQPGRGRGVCQTHPCQPRRRSRRGPRTAHLRNPVPPPTAQPRKLTATPTAPTHPRQPLADLEPPDDAEDPAPTKEICTIARAVTIGRDCPARQARAPPPVTTMSATDVYSQGRLNLADLAAAMAATLDGDRWLDDVAAQSRGWHLLGNGFNASSEQLRRRPGVRAVAGQDALEVAEQIGNAEERPSAATADCPNVTSRKGPGAASGRTSARAWTHRMPRSRVPRQLDDPLPTCRGPDRGRPFREQRGEPGPSASLVRRPR
jgi:hypothetical protein